MANTEVNITYQNDNLPPRKDSDELSFSEIRENKVRVELGDISIIYNREGIDERPPLVAYHPPIEPKKDVKKKVAITYSPLRIPLWEKFMGPGSMAASLVCVILIAMALYITIQPPENKIVTYTEVEALYPDEIQDSKLAIIKLPEVFEAKDFSEIIVDNVVEEVVEQEDIVDTEFPEASGDVDNISTVDFDNINTLKELGGASLASGKRGQRRAGRRQLLLANGGSRRTEQAVTAALDWLRRHQQNEGRWSVHDYTQRCGREKKRGYCSGVGQERCFDIGGSALSLLAYSGRGLDHKIVGPFQKTIEKGKDYLVSRQNRNGLFGKKYETHYVYNHVLSTFALADLLLMSGDESLRPPLDRAVRYLEKTQNPGWSWRYNFRGEDQREGMRNDTSVTAWVVMALKTAKECNITVSEKSFDGAKKWLDYAYTEPTKFRPATYAYIKPNAKTSMYLYGRPYCSTACGMLARQFMEQSNDMTPCAETLREALPDWKGVRNMYYWYYGSMAMFQVGGDYWEEWNDAIRPAMVESQNKRSRDCRYGSWDPDKDAYGVLHSKSRAGVGGRVYTTSMGALTLEVYYRYSRIRDKK
jgi:hypothetical protein